MAAVPYCLVGSYPQRIVGGDEILWLARYSDGVGAHCMCFGKDQVVTLWQYKSKLQEAEVVVVVEVVVVEEEEVVVVVVVVEEGVGVGGGGGGGGVEVVEGEVEVVVDIRLDEIRGDVVIQQFHFVVAFLNRKMHYTFIHSF